MKSAIADIGKLMEDYTASLLETSRGRSESVVAKSITIPPKQRDKVASRKEFSVLDKRQKENVNCRSDSDHVATHLDCDRTLHRKFEILYLYGTGSTLINIYY